MDSGGNVTVVMDRARALRVAAVIADLVRDRLELERAERADRSRPAFAAGEVLGLARQLRDLAGGPAGGRERPRILPAAAAAGHSSVVMVSLSDWATGRGVSVRTARRWAASGVIPDAAQVAGRWMVPADVAVGDVDLDGRQTA